MKPIHFEFENTNITKPEGWTDEQCVPLPAYTGKDTEGNDVIISCWELTDEEFEQLSKTRKVWLGVMGKQTPPAWLAVQSPFEIIDNQNKIEQ